MNERSRQYQTTSIEQRQNVIYYRHCDYTDRQISILLGIRVRTVMSIKNIERQDAFSPIEGIFIKLICEHFKGEQFPSSRKVIKFIKSVMKKGESSNLNEASLEYNKKRKIKFTAGSRKLFRRVFDKFVALLSDQNEMVEQQSYDLTTTQNESHREETHVSVDYDTISKYLNLQKDEFLPYDDQEGAKL